MMDIVMMLGSIPRPGTDVLAERGLLTTGGGFNSMSSAARQGMSVVYAGKLGTGPFSTLATHSLEEEGITAPILPNQDSDAGFCVVIVEDSGERTFMTSRGAEGTLQLTDLQMLDAGDGDFVLVSGYNVMYPGLAEMVLEWISELSDGVIVALDPSNRVSDIPATYLESILARADWILCNETEARDLTGSDEPAVAAVSIAALTRRGDAVVRHGATGCTVVHDGSGPVTVSGFATKVVDTNGAGDTHNGVFIAELSRGTAPEEAARRANAAASMAISELGPAMCPNRELIDSRLAQPAELASGGQSGDVAD